MGLIGASRCVLGDEQFVELALREGLSNAMIHGNRLDPRKLVHVRCCCDFGKGVFILVRDQGPGFDPNNVPRSEEHTSELQSHLNLVCRLLLEKKKNKSK